MVDKLKSISTTATLVTTRQGHLHVEVAAPSVHVAVELQGMSVLPSNTSNQARALTYAPLPPSP